MAKGSHMAAIKSGAILVTGGSGIVGRYLVRSLAQAGKTVVSMYRHRLPEPMPNVYPVCTDLASIDLLKAPLRGVECVVYLAWDMEEDWQEPSFDVSFQRAPKNVCHVRNMVKAMEMVGTRRIIFVSANGAGRSASHPFLREKYYAELAVINSQVMEKMIVRPTIIFQEEGHLDAFTKAVVDITRYPAIYPVPKLAAELAPIHVQDFCQILKNAIDSRLDSGIGILEVIGSEKYSISEIFRLIASRYSKGAKLQITGILGNALMKLVERSHKNDGQGVGRFLALGHELCQETSRANPMNKALPRDYKSFRKALTF